MEDFSKFRLVGARFSRICVNEHALGGNGDKNFRVTIESRDAVISQHTYSDRKVIEKVVCASAFPKEVDEGPVDEIFTLECTAGFVGAEESLDGDLQAFKKSDEAYGRAIYWLVRERIESIFSVTMLRSSRNLPWDMAFAADELKSTRVKTERKSPKTSPKKRVTKKVVG